MSEMIRINMLLSCPTISFGMGVTIEFRMRPSYSRAMHRDVRM
jgi:hypothetical protein